MKYAIAQNKWYAQSLLPEGWSADCIAISGGFIGWSDAMTPHKALGLSYSQVLDHMHRRLPDPQQYAGKIVHLDFENPINPSSLEYMSQDFSVELANAMRLRWAAANEFFPNSARLIGDYGGRTWQDRPTTKDNRRLIVMGRLASLGAFEGLHGCLFRCYPAYPETHRLWRRLPDVFFNNLRAAATIFGEDSLLMPAFSWHVDGNDEKEAFGKEAIEEMAEMGIKHCGVAGFWGGHVNPEMQVAA